MNTPIYRKLRGYAFDPSLSRNLDTYYINEITYQIPWEEISMKDGVLQGEYLEIVDYDPSVDKFYETVNLNDPYILAEHGLEPSENNPMFHQQMVYAVAMTTIKNFEHALGRKVLWSTRRLNYDPPNGKNKYEEYVDKLRIYPHALREANAYYSPSKKALLFGYFHSNPGDQALQMPGSLIFTCLSHDIIAHEVTHAILDGMQRHYNDPTNPDVLAFHEAFADIVSLFQHFTFPEVLKHQISNTKGDLSAQNILGELAQEFGVAVGNYGSLRSAIGDKNSKTGLWERHEPDPNNYHEIQQPHARGSLLVAAVFEAFLSIYKRRTADLYRIASNGTGILPKGELHPDLVNRLAEEASKISRHILNMCIRAIDYCPPTDINFGDFLRAIITADADLVRDDHYGYRLAFIEAFKRRGIFPTNATSLSVESLQYPEIEEMKRRNLELVKIIVTFLRDYNNQIAYHKNRNDIYDITKAIISGDVDDGTKDKMNIVSETIHGLHKRIQVKFDRSNQFIGLSGLAFTHNWENLGIRTSNLYGRPGPSFQVQNLRLVSRIGPDGQKIDQVVFSILQRCGVVMDGDKVSAHFQPGYDDQIPEEYNSNGFIFRGGCTFILDLDTRELKYAISKPLLVKGSNSAYEINEEAIKKQWKHMNESFRNNINQFQQYFGAGLNNRALEPFSLLHQH